MIWTLVCKVTLQILCKSCATAYQAGLQVFMQQHLRWGLSPIQTITRDFKTSITVMTLCVLVCLCVCMYRRHVVVRSDPDYSQQENKFPDVLLTCVTFYPPFRQHKNGQKFSACCGFLSASSSQSYLSTLSLTSLTCICSAHKSCRNSVFLDKSARRLEP